jgi:hypothetical protein
MYFFAMDVFGGQFGYRGDSIVYFEPETGEVEEFSVDLERWAKRILEDADVLTGYPLARSWQRENGQLKHGDRLVPIQAFVSGGKYVVENLRPYDAASGMRIRGPIARAISDLPDGTAITFKIVE